MFLADPSQITTTPGPGLTVPGVTNGKPVAVSETDDISVQDESEPNDPEREGRIAR